MYEHIYMKEPLRGGENPHPQRPAAASQEECAEGALLGRLAPGQRKGSTALSQGTKIPWRKVPLDSVTALYKGSCRLRNSNVNCWGQREQVDSKKLEVLEKPETAFK